LNNATDSAATILVVDDEWMNRELMDAVLQSAGYQVLLANSSEKALELVANQRPDLALVDVRLRHGSGGYDLCRQLKAMPGQPSILVMMVTALENDETRERAMQAGADDFIGRMTDLPQFLARIDALLHGRTT
jgi:CheY-like chemotaxis protein